MKVARARIASLSLVSLRESIDTSSAAGRLLLVPHLEGFNIKPLFRRDVESLRVGIGFTTGSEKLSESGVPL